MFQDLLNLMIVIWSILAIILFFKVWGMTNDISAIREILSGRVSMQPEESADAKPAASEPVILGPLVVDKTGKQYRVVRKEGDMVVIRSSVYGERTVHASEIEPFAPPQKK